ARLSEARLLEDATRDGAADPSDDEPDQCSDSDQHAPAPGSVGRGSPRSAPGANRPYGMSRIGAASRHPARSSGGSVRRCQMPFGVGVIEVIMDSVKPFRFGKSRYAGKTSDEASASYRR